MGGMLPDVAILLLAMHFAGTAKSSMRWTDVKREASIISIGEKSVGWLSRDRFSAKTLRIRDSFSTRMRLRGGMDMIQDGLQQGQPSQLAIKRIQGEILAMKKKPPDFFRFAVALSSLQPICWLAFPSSLPLYTLTPSCTAISTLRSHIFEILDVPRASPMDHDILDWHFVLLGVKGSAFEGGLYHGRILLDNVRTPPSPSTLFCSSLPSPHKILESR
eukprot:1951670-Rhodomonas_salina.2